MERPSSEALKALEKAIAASGKAELPDEGEFHYYRNFACFKEQVDRFRGRLQMLLTSLPAAGPPPPSEVFEDADEVGDWVTTLLDASLEQVDDAVAETRRALQAGPVPPPSSTAILTAMAAGVAQLPAPVQAAAAGRHRSGGSTGAGGSSSGDGFVSYMSSQVQRRPQEAFTDHVDNSRAPFKHKLDSLAGVIDVEAAAADAAAAAAAGQPRPHPLQQRLEALQYPAWQLAQGEAQPPQSYDETPFTFIDTVPALWAAVQRLAAAKEVAIDLEAHSYRSFQGFCCLMQLSTRSEDMVIDTLALRAHVGPALAPVLADPGVVKVLHGADSDVVWLQRDYGLFLANLFDTGQAARVLELKGHGLAHLLDFYCGFKADKRFQLADWRVRPLTQEMLHYARSDTHYLLYCYDRLKATLAAAGTAVPEHLAVELPPAAAAAAAAPGSSVTLATVLERSRQLCLLQYEREQYSPLAFMDLFTRLNTTLSDEQLSVFAAMYEWRDSVCRHLDESTGYVLPRAQLLKVAQAMPCTALELHKVVGRSSATISRHVADVLAAIKAARQPEAVAAIREMRQQPWKQMLVEQKQQQHMAVVAGPAAVALEPAPTATNAKPALQPRAVKPLAAAGDGGSGLLGAVVAARPALQPKVVESLAPSGMGAVFTVAAAPAAQAASLAAPAPQEAPEAAAVEQTAAVKPSLKARQLKPLALHQKPAAGGLFGVGGGGAAALQAAGAGPQQQQLPPAARASLLGRGKPSAVGSLLGVAGSSSGMAAAAAAVKASFALPFSFAAASVAATQEVVAAAPTAVAPAAAAAEPGLEAEPAAEGAGGASQRGAIRAAVEAMQGKDGQQVEDAQQQQEEAAAAAAMLTRKGMCSDLGEFMPLPISVKYGKGAVKRWQPGDGGKKALWQQQQPEQQLEQHLKQTMVELGLDDASDMSDEEPQEEPVSKKKRPQQQQQQGLAAAGQRLDYQSAKAKFDLGIINTHALPKEEPVAGCRRGGRGGRGARDGGASGGRGGARGGGRGGRSGGKEDPASRFPAGKFNPSANPELGAIKAGKRSAVHVRSGNRSMTFRE